MKSNLADFKGYYLTKKSVKEELRKEFLPNSNANTQFQLRVG